MTFVAIGDLTARCAVLAGAGLASRCRVRRLSSITGLASRCRVRRLSSITGLASRCRARRRRCSILMESNETEPLTRHTNDAEQTERQQTTTHVAFANCVGYWSWIHFQ